MANVLLPLFSRRRFDFSTLTASTTMQWVEVRRIPVLGAREAMLLVRVHTRTIDAGADITLTVVDSSPTPEDPQLDFREAGNRATLAIAAGTTLLYVEQKLTSPFGSHVDLLVLGRRGASGSCVADLAADLVLKE